MSSLSDYLNEHMPADWSKAQLVEALAGVVDRATVYRYLSGRHPRTPSDAVLQAFVNVLPGTSVRELRAAAAIPADEDDPWIPPVEANQLNSGQRAALTAFIRATVNWQDFHEEPVDEAEIRSTRPLNLPESTRAEVQTYVEELHASGISNLADRVAATLVISSASDTANRSSKD
jgi:hypothetical protein